MNSNLIQSPVVREFVLHWGEMGTKWGINRTVAQIHALLFASDRPLTAEEIAASLSIARSNVSVSLKELESWRLIRVTHRVGDRKEYYESLQDVWEMFRLVLRERKRRELDPTVVALRRCIAEADKSGGDSHAKRKIGEMLEFFETSAGCFDQLDVLPDSAFKKLMKVGGRIAKLVG